MTHLVGHDRSQTLLLPESLDDYVDAENPVRFIEAFVDGLDLAAAGFIRIAAKPIAPQSRDAPQHRGDLAAAASEAGLQDHR